MSHSCPIGFIAISSRLISTTVSDAHCCQGTCASHECPSGYTRIASLSSSLSVSDDHCCQVTCARHSCPSGYIPIASRASWTTVSDNHCCQARTSPRRVVSRSSKLRTLIGNSPSGRQNPQKQVNAVSRVIRHASIKHSKETSTAFISQNLASDEADDADMGQALQNMKDLLKDNFTEGVAAKDDESVVHESEALESTIENTEDSLKSEATQEETIVKEQLKQDLKDYAKMDGPAEKAIAESDTSNSNDDDADDDITEELTLPESGDSLPLSPSENIVHTRTARVLPRSLLGFKAAVAKSETDNAQVNQSQTAYEETANAVDSMDNDADVSAKIYLSGSSADAYQNSQSEAKARIQNKSSSLQADDHRFASRLPSLDDLARAIPNVDKDALEMYNSVDDSDLGTSDDSLDVPPSFVQLVQEQAVIIPQADLDAVWNSLKTLADHTHAGLNMIDLLRHAAPRGAQTKTRSSLHGHLQYSFFAAHQDQGVGQQCNWLLRSFEQRQENRMKMNAVVKRAKSILARTRIRARRLRGWR